MIFFAGDAISGFCSLFFTLERLIIWEFIKAYFLFKLDSKEGD